jgi:hypothetical protein
LDVKKGDNMQKGGKRGREILVVSGSIGAAIAISSFASKAEAATHRGHRGRVFGVVPFFLIDNYASSNFVPVSSRPKYHPGLWGDTRFGWTHSGYLAPDIVYDCSIAGEMTPEGIPHTGFVTRDIYQMPSTLKSQFVPYDSGRNDVLRQYEHSVRRPQRDWRKELEQQRVSGEEERKRRKDAIEARKSMAEENKATQGLRETDLIRSYFEAMGEKIYLAPMNAPGKTAAVCITLDNHPELAIDWHDENIIKEMLSHKGRAGFAYNYERRITKMKNAGITVDVITETEPGKIISRLEGIAVRLKLPAIDYNTFFSELEKNKPYILGPDYKPIK